MAAKSHQDQGEAPSGRDPDGERRRWDERYRLRLQEPDREPADFLRQQVASLPTGCALVLAMGEGRHALYLAGLGHEVTGVDISPVAVERCRRAAAARGLAIETAVADLGSYDLGRGCFGLITDFYFFDRLLLPRVVTALEPGGLLVLETFAVAHRDLDSPVGPRNPHYLFDPDKDLAALSTLQIRTYEELIVGRDDPAAKGPAAIVRLVARKPSP